jgi:hypothetical protein
MPQNTRAATRSSAPLTSAVTTTINVGAQA